MKSNKLATTMGIELSFVPAILDRAMDVNWRKAKSEEPDQIIDCRATSSICEGYSSMLRGMLQMRGIRHYNCAQDPDCVEVSTTPYSNKGHLLSACRKIIKEAAKIDCFPTSRWYNGGGAHIHVGCLGESDSECEEFATRMMLFAATNPWLSWAFIGLSDKINAEPLHRGLFKKSKSNLKNKIASLTTENASDLETLIQYTNRLHEAGRRTSEYRIEDMESDVDEYRREYVRTKFALHEMKKTFNESNVIFLTNHKFNRHIAVDCGKDKVFRVTEYGDKGTVEFRAFEMPEDLETLERYIDFANAVVKHVSAQTYTSFKMSAIPTHHAITKMPWSKRIAGFNKMLLTLGLNPEDYREERAQISRRMRYWAAIRRELNPKPVEPAVEPADRDYDIGVGESQIIGSTGINGRRTRSRSFRFPEAASRP